MNDTNGISYSMVDKEEFVFIIKSDKVEWMVDRMGCA
jgi:hypothetical protein